MTLITPAEWSPHRAFWLGFPSHEDLWQENLVAAQVEVADLARALAGPGGERVRLMICGDAAEHTARRLLADVSGVELVRGQFGDVWLRDTGPIFVRQQGADAAVGFQFNGWGGKYVLDGDEGVADQIAAASGVPLTPHAFILEGGAIDHDGFGAVLTTRQCLLNPNRNPGWTEATAEAALAAALGARKVLWLDEGLVGDHTDGHVDNLARFVAPGVVACPVAFGRDDPNAEVYDETARRLSAMTSARGAPLQVARIVSPGRIETDEGEVVPASHMNFIIANDAVVAPIYDEASGAFAVEALRSLFPERTVIGLPSRALLTGGGSFHCISQQVPGMSRILRVAAIQTAYGADLADNITRTQDLVRQAAAGGAQVILPSELFQGPYFCVAQEERWFATAHPWREHPCVLAMAPLAAELGVVIPVSIFEREGPHYFNSLVMLDADGRALGIYRKSHIPDGPGYMEKYYFRPGDTGFKVWDTRFGRVGVGICWDQWYPECARAMALLGAEILLYPTAIGSEPHDDSLDTAAPWRRAMQGHAVSNIIPVVGANRTGFEPWAGYPGGGQRFYGSSFIADHRGDLVSSLGRDEEGLVSASFDLDFLATHRAAWGFFRDRRPDLYGALAQPRPV